MKASLSTTCIIDLNNPKKYMSYVSAAGFGSMMLDLGMLYAKSDFEDYGTKNSKCNVTELCKQYDQLIEQSLKHSIQIDSMRMPQLKWDTKREDLNGLLLQIGEKCIKACSRLGCHYIIVQPLFSGIMKADRYQENYRYCLKLGEVAKENNVYILLENQCDNINGHLIRGMCSDVSAASGLIDEINRKLNSEVAGFCLNTEVCSLCGQDMGEMAAELGNKLKAVLVKERDGIHETGRLPETSGSNKKWLKMIRGLRKIEYDGMLIMDAGKTLLEFSHLLRSQMYPVIKSVTDFFCWQIEMERHLKKYSNRVLFGAGKMCQNYVEYYGKNYPPLFVCDNNPQLWGTKVCGLHIKSPEALQKLPKDCGVIICNVFYKEIAEQLKVMGIKNIGSFNDEYLPEFADLDKL